jgi:Family of unknown function (DUF5677)
MATIPGVLLLVDSLGDNILLPLAPVPGILAELLRRLPDYGGPSNAARDYLRDSIELGLEHLAGACSAWGSGAYFPCEASCRTAFEISVNVLYILQSPEERACQHQLASVLHEQEQLKEALKLAEQMGLAALVAEISGNLEMIEGQLEIIKRLAPAAAAGNTSAGGTWPSMKQRLQGIGEHLDYPTLYSVLCRSTHGDAEPLLERLLARIIAQGTGNRTESVRPLLLRFRETTRAFSKMMVAQASFRLVKAAGLFADHYKLRPLLELTLANLDAVRVLGEEAAGETRALRESEAWKSA